MRNLGRTHPAADAAGWVPFRITRQIGEGYDNRYL